MTGLPSLTLFFPCCDDEVTIGPLVMASDRVARDLTEDYELIVIDDGSADGSRAVLEDLQARLPRLRVVRHETHQGYGAVLQSGFAHASKEWVFYTDGDGQYEVSELERLVSLTPSGADMVSGYKIKRRDPLYRVIVGGLYQRFAKRLFGVSVRDVDCGFRLLRRKVFDRIHLTCRTGVVCLELVTKLERAGYRLAECPVTHYPRAHGRSRFFTVSHLLRAARDLWRLWVKFRRGKSRREESNLRPAHYE